MTITRVPIQSDKVIPKRQNFPGASLPGMTNEKYKQSNITAKRSKCFRIALSANSTTSTQIILSGTAKLLLGLNIFIVDAANLSLTTLTINNDKAIDAVLWKQLTNASAICTFDEEYFPYERLLSGNDAINLDLNSDTGTTAFATFHYI